MKVFIGGPRSISRLNKLVKERLLNITNNSFTILVGDANGVDKAIQNFCNELNYSNVQVFASNGKARNNIGNWEIIEVEVPKSKKGFDFYAAKDIAMAKDSDCGFMIWNGQSKGTLNNIVNLCSMNKKVLVYFAPHKKFYAIKELDDIKWLVKQCDSSINDLLYECLKRIEKNSQISLDI